MKPIRKIVCKLFLLLLSPLSLFSQGGAFYPLTILNSDLPPLEEATESILKQSIAWEEQRQMSRELELSNALYWLSWLPSFEVEYGYQNRKAVEENDKYQWALTLQLKQPIPLGWEWAYEIKGQKRKKAQSKELEKNLLQQIQFEMENRYLHLFQMEEEYNYLVMQNHFWQQIHRIAQKRKEFQQIKETDYQSILISWEENQIREKSCLHNLKYEFQSLLLSIGEKKVDCQLPLFAHHEEPFKLYQEKRLKKKWILQQQNHHPDWKSLTWSKEELEDQLVVNGLTILPRLEYQMEWNLVDYDGYYLINQPQSGFRILFQLPWIQGETQWSQKKLPYEQTESAIGKNHFNSSQWNPLASLVKTKEALTHMEKKIALLQKRLPVELENQIEKIENLKEQLINQMVHYNNQKKQQEIDRLLYEKGERELYRLADGEKASFALLAQIGEMRFSYFQLLFDLAMKSNCSIKELFEETRFDKTITNEEKP